jgi:hypothetical protein
MINVEDVSFLIAVYIRLYHRSLNDMAYIIYQEHHYQTINAILFFLQVRFGWLFLNETNYDTERKDL